MNPRRDIPRAGSGPQTRHVGEAATSDATKTQNKLCCRASSKKHRIFWNCIIPIIFNGCCWSIYRKSNSPRFPNLRFQKHPLTHIYRFHNSIFFSWNECIKSVVKSHELKICITLCLSSWLMDNLLVYTACIFVASRFYKNM